MEKQNIYVYDDSQLSFAVDLMDRFKVNYLPVVYRQNKKKVAGILSYRDVFSVYRKRNNEENIYNRKISLGRKGYKLIVKGRQLFQG